MNSIITESYADLLKTENYYPSVSIIMPFKINIDPKKEVSIHLKSMIKKTSEEILKNYPNSIAEPVVKKLKTAIKNIDYTKVKNSIAIFISPIFEKIYYLDLPVEERIVIDDSFEIRDLIYSKNDIHKYLLVILSSKNGVFYLGNTDNLVRLRKIKATDIDAINHDLPEKVANFTDESKIKEILLDKFLKYNEKELKGILEKYKLPVFIMGASKTLGHFKKITHDKKNIVEYIQGNYEEQTENQLLNIIEPHIIKWDKKKKEDLLKIIDDAMSDKKLAIGIRSVWKCATEKKGRHLIVEKNYVYPARQSSRKEIIFEEGVVKGNNKLYIKDAVDDVIEKIISSGGIVEFVDEGLLKDYQKIVLIQYY